jgi:hypothetical protein
MCRVFCRPKVASIHLGDDVVDAVQARLSAVGGESNEDQQTSRRTNFVGAMRINTSVDAPSNPQQDDVCY